MREIVVKMFSKFIYSMQIRSAFSDCVKIISNKIFNFSETFYFNTKFKFLELSLLASRHML